MIQSAKLLPQPSGILYHSTPKKMPPADRWEYVSWLSVLYLILPRLPISLLAVYRQSVVCVSHVIDQLVTSGAFFTPARKGTLQFIKFRSQPVTVKQPPLSNTLRSSMHRVTGFEFRWDRDFVRSMLWISRHPGSNHTFWIKMSSFLNG